MRDTSYAAVRDLSLDMERLRLKREGAPEAERLRAAWEQIAVLNRELQELREYVGLLEEENETATARADSAETRLKTAKYRIQQLTAQIRVGGGNPDQNIRLPPSWAKFADWCEEYLTGRVVLSPRARQQVKAPLFRDVAQAARCLLWLANEYRDRRLKGGGGGAARSDHERDQE